MIISLDNACRGCNMLNQFIVIGKIQELPMIRETSNGNKISTLLLEVDRNFKNSDGLYERDSFQITLWKGIAESTVHLAEIGSLIAVKGRVQSNTYEGKDGVHYYNYEIIAEKVSFLTQKENQ